MKQINDIKKAENIAKIKEMQECALSPPNNLL
jgi:hypothetical protein